MDALKVGSFQDVIKDMESGVFDFTKDGKCSGCGACCSNFLPISENEVKRIAAYVRKYNVKEQKHFVPTATPPIDFTCPFRNNVERKCEIYPVRPAICRDFQCDKPRKKIEADRNLYESELGIVFMRETFFNGNATKLDKKIGFRLIRGEEKCRKKQEK